MPYKIQLYYRSRDVLSAAFLHDRYILVYLIDGEVDMELNGNSLCRLTPGRMMLIFPGCAHRMVPVAGAVNHVLQVSFSLSGTPGAEMQLLNGVVLNSDGVMRRLLRQMMTEFVGNYEIHHSNILPCMLGELLERLRLKHTSAMPEMPTDNEAKYAGRSSDIFRQISAYCMSNLHRKITIAELAEHMRFSSSNLRLLFRKYFGGSLGRYLRNRRLLLATALLNGSGLSVKQIAERCGYDSTASFCRAYKRESGVSPLDLRRKSENL